MKNIINKVKQFAKEKHVIVVGDIMLDEYIFGEVTRISPEAPVPIIKTTKKDWSLGGAANVALNCRHIGCKVDLIGIVGKDDSRGEKVFSMLQQNRIDTFGLIRSNQRITTCKKRVMAEGQQLLRIDVEDDKPLTENEFINLTSKLNKIIKNKSIILISDYLKGVLSKEFLSKIMQEAKKRQCTVIVDPKGKNFDKYFGSNYIKPNYKEYCQLVSFLNLSTKCSIVENGKKICRCLNLDGLIVTLGEKGIQFVSEKKDIYIPACQKEVYDLTGAGDTVIAFLALGFSVGLEMKQCLMLANHAAAVAVSHLKTYAVSLDELIDKNVEHCEKIFHNWAMLKIELDWLKLENKKIVFTNGCFDLLHSGHLHLLQEAKKQGNILVVAVNTDDSVRRFKGNQRPIKNIDERMRLLSAMTVVDFVVSFDQDTPKELIEYLHPNVLVKGADYYKEKVAGYDFMIRSGGRVHIVDYQKGYATTNLVKKIKQFTC
ncbi:D-glycero-beta-D-manno-heptose 1-phosphate adenylyltransferase [Candidatus Dependentiae bacterium]|nr:D-glycero-beta-D-manno-heptose 1-phosphate adenylyltransferase [Candidatus Dependentiae bacterium]